MKVSAIRCSKHFFFTFITDGNIRRNKNLPFCFFTFDNVKLMIQRRILYFFYIHFQDSCSFGWFIFDIGNKTIYCFLGTLGKNFHIRTFVADISMYLPCHGMSGYSRPEPYPLNNSINPDLFCDLFFVFIFHKISRFCSPDLRELFFQTSSISLPETAKCLTFINLSSGSDVIGCIAASATIRSKWLFFTRFI